MYIKSPSPSATDVGGDPPPPRRVPRDARRVRLRPRPRIALGPARGRPTPAHAAATWQADVAQRGEPRRSLPGALSGADHGHGSGPGPPRRLPGCPAGGRPYRGILRQLLQRRLRGREIVPRVLYGGVARRAHGPGDRHSDLVPQRPPDVVLWSGRLPPSR